MPYRFDSMHVGDHAPNAALSGKLHVRNTTGITARFDNSAATDGLDAQIIITDIDTGADQKHKYLQSRGGTLKCGKINDAINNKTEQWSLDNNGIFRLEFNLAISDGSGGTVATTGRMRTARGFDLYSRNSGGADAHLLSYSTADVFALRTDRFVVDSMNMVGIGTLNPLMDFAVAVKSSFHYPVALPADSELAVSSLTFFIDEANNMLEIKARYSTGVVKLAMIMSSIFLLNGTASSATPTWTALSPANVTVP